MTTEDLDILVEAQNKMEKLWLRFARLSSMDASMLCKLRFNIETKDGFIPTKPVMDWLNNLLKETER